MKCQYLNSLLVLLLPSLYPSGIAAAPFSLYFWYCYCSNALLLLFSVVFVCVCVVSKTQFYRNNYLFVLISFIQTLKFTLGLARMVWDFSIALTSCFCLNSMAVFDCKCCVRMLWLIDFNLKLDKQKV